MNNYNKRLKFIGYSIVMQEVPGEVSLAINISDCPYRCKDCHSKYLWEYNGEYLGDKFEDLVDVYGNMITCVCFMGGTQNSEELLNYIRIAKKRNLKTCVYTGCDTLSKIYPQLLSEVDYIKIGRYIEEFGGLACKTTNQKFYDLKNNKEILLYKN